MSFPSDTEKELEQYGAAVGIAISNGLHEEGLDLAFTRGGGILIRENLPGTSLPGRADLDANAVGGADATLTYLRGEKNDLSGMNITSYSRQGTVKFEQSGGQLTSLTVDKDGDGNPDAALQYQRENDALRAIQVDEDNNGKIDAVLLPEFTGETDVSVRGFNVDLGVDGTIDGFAEFIRNENGQVKSIRFRQLQ